jgi:FAD/FMN-containing dehydrogenase
VSTHHVGKSGDGLASTLRHIAGERNVVDDPAVRAQYERDWTGRFHGTARFVVRPGSTAEVARVIEACAAAEVAVVPQGGNTGLVGGGVPRDGEVVVSLTRLDELGQVDTATRQVEVGAGVTLHRLQEHAAASGLDAGLDLAARDAATVGGLTACEAGGVHALRYGTARMRVAALEAVLADGSVIGPGASVVKNNSGYSFASVMVGSEGSLGVITRVRWQLVPAVRARVAALVPLSTVDEAVSLFRLVRPLLTSLNAAELILDAGMQAVLAHLRLPSPLPSPAPAYVLLECADDEDPTEEFVEALERAAVADAIVARDSNERARLWQFREAQSEAVSRLGTPHKFDVGVPLSQLSDFIRRASDVVQHVAPGARVFLFGHLGDGNVHVNVIADRANHDELAAAVFGAVAACGGTVSAEHGIGVEKTRWLHLVHTPGELAAMVAIKRAFDPRGLLNPGVAVPPVDDALRAFD